jgi:3-deoxy-D-manno-octulosonic-acid transferase
LSDKSFKRYARFPNLSRLVLTELSTIAAQTEADAQRLRKLGAERIAIMGNLKFDIEPPPAMLALGQQMRVLFGADRRIFLAASTREGEEALILDALKKSEIDGLLTIIVPRHPQRFTEVAALIERSGFKFQLRSSNQAIHADTQVVLGDSMGEMFAYYAACDVAFIGGSLLKFGGQNLIEACSVGKPVLIGQHTYNFTLATELAIECRAALRVSDSSILVKTLKTLFDSPLLIQSMSSAGFRFVLTNQGATERALLEIKNALFR